MNAVEIPVVGSENWKLTGELRRMAVVVNLYNLRYEQTDRVS
jgi:hypothetical protein